jgi:predicted DCC family thiol-disulfide oxidoreductase YuxK
VSLQLVLLLVPAIAVEVGACNGCSVGFQMVLAHTDPSEYLPLPALKVLMLPFGPWGTRPEPMFLHAIWLLAAVTGFTSLLGLYARPSLMVFAATTTLLTAHSYSYGEYHHPEALMTIALWALALSPSGAALSLDHLRARFGVAAYGLQFTPSRMVCRQSELARWPLRLMQWCLALMYLSAGMAKLVKGGLTWFNGYTLALYIGHDAVTRGSTLGIWFATQIPLLIVLSVATVAIELTFFLGVLFPVLTVPYAFLGLGMHLGIQILQRAPFPQTMALYVVFIETFRRQLVPLFKGTRPRPSWTAIYDGLCPLCLRSMVLLDSMDWRYRLDFIDLERDWPRAAATVPSLTADLDRRTLLLIGPDARLYRGFFAFRELAALLPPLWPLWPLVQLPGLGRSIYWIVAGGHARHGRLAEAAEPAQPPAA